MASMFMVKHLVMNNTILRLNLASKAGHLLFPRLPISKVSFSSASKLKQHRYPTSDADAEEDAKESERRRMVQPDYDDEEAEKVADEIKRRAKDTASSVSETAKEGSHKAGETNQTMHEAKEKAKDTAKGAWETAKDATRRTKETVVGEDDDEDKRKSAVDCMEDLNLPQYGDARDAEVRDQSKLRSGT